MKMGCVFLGRFLEGQIIPFHVCLHKEVERSKKPCLCVLLRLDCKCLQIGSQKQIASYSLLFLDVSGTAELGNQRRIQLSLLTGNLPV